MTRALVLALVVTSLVAAAGPAFAKAKTKGPRRSTPIALSENGKTLVNVNPDDDTITVFKVTSMGLVSRGQLLVEGDPASVAISPDNVTAWVANSKSGTVCVIDLRKLRIKKTIAVGAEPSAVAVSPNGTRVYVANSASNDLTVIDAKKRTVRSTVDLSALGTSPRAIAITNDGDGKDNDETVFVAMFFGQTRAGKTSADEGQDDQKEGCVAAVSTATDTAAVAPVRLAPMADAGFKSNGKLAPAAGLTPSVLSTNPATFTTATGAFPNQLAAIAIRPGKGIHAAYVVSTAASPNGPFRFNTNAHGLVSVFDTTTKAEITAPQTDLTLRRTAPLNLNQGVNLDTLPVPRLFFTNPVAIAWRPNGADAWIVAQQSDAVVRMTVDVQGVPTIGAPLVAGPGQIVRIDLQNRANPPADADVPRGIAIDPKGRYAYVWNYASRTIATIDLSALALVRTIPSSPSPAAGSPAADFLRGAALFHTGRGPQGRMSSEGWGSCAVCHPNGRSDNVTWMFDAGPRQTISLDGTFARSDPSDQRILNWSAVRDEVHDFELNTRSVSGGRGLIDDDRLYFSIGGATTPVPTSDASTMEQFNRATGVVGATDDLAAGAGLPSLAALTPRRDFAVATLPDGRVYILGGRTGPGPGVLVPAADAVLEFDPRTATLAQRSSNGFTIRHSLGAAAVTTPVGTRIYAIGGYPAASSSLPVPLVEEFDPATGAWRSVAQLPTAVAQFGVAVAGGGNTSEPLQLIHVVGGNTFNELTPSVANPTPVQRFQPSTTGPGTWSTFAPVGLTLRHNLGCASVRRGTSSRIMVVGGRDALGTVIPTVEEYAAQAVLMTATPPTPLPAARERFGIPSGVGEGHVFVIGGLDAAGAPQTSVYEMTVDTNGPAPGPAGTPSGAWTLAANLNTARFGLQTSSPPPVTNFLPVANAGRDARLNALARWVQFRVRAVRAAVRSDQAAVASGRAAFAQDGLVVPNFSCATCHGGPKWTRSRVDFPTPPSPEVAIGPGLQRIIGAELRQTAAQGANVLIDVGTFTLSAGRTNEIRANSADVSQAVAPLGANGFNVPSLLSVGETAPYFYNGMAATLEQVLDGSHDHRRPVSGAGQIVSIQCGRPAADEPLWTWRPDRHPPPNRA